MTKEKLVKLYDFFKKNNITFNYGFDSIKRFSDQDVDRIITSRYPKVILELLTDEIFKSYNDFIKNQIINSIERCKSKNIARSVACASSSSVVRDSGEILEICKVISQSVDEIQAYCVSNLVSGGAVLHYTWPMRILQIISRADEKIVYPLTSLIINRNIIDSNKLHELLDIICSAKCDNEQIIVALDVANNKQLIDDNKVINYIKILLNANGYGQACVAKHLIQNNPDISESIIEIICNASRTEQAKDAASILDSNRVKNNKEEYARVIANSNTSGQSYYGMEFVFFNEFEDDLVLTILKLICSSNYPMEVYSIAKCKKFHIDEHLLCLLNIINNANGIQQIYFAFEYLDSNLAVTSEVVENMRLICGLSTLKIKYLKYENHSILQYLNNVSQNVFLRNLSNALSEEEIKKVYQDAVSLIDRYDSKPKFVEEIEYQDEEYDFWTMLESQPDEAIELVKVQENIELTDGIKLKRQKK